MANKIKQARTKTACDEIDVLYLTTAETFLLLRRRKNWTQGRAAKFFKINLSFYKRLEYGVIAPPLRVKDAARLGRVEDHEYCYIHRRRAKKSQIWVAKKLKKCRFWINQMERGKVDCDTLLKFWNEQ